MVAQKVAGVNEFAGLEAGSEGSGLALGTTTEKGVGGGSDLAIGLGSLFSVNPETGEVEKTATAVSRVERYTLQRLSGQFCSQMHSAGENVSDRITYCGRHVNGDYASVLRDYSRGGRAIYGGLRVCANAWLCPVCASVIQQRRAAECRQAIETASSHGYQASMITLTVPHNYGDDLPELVRSLCAAWSSMVKFSGFRSWKRSVGYLGYIRSFELTHGDNGWHPHFHVIFFTRCSIKTTRTRRRLYRSWASACRSQGLRVPSYRHGLDVSDDGDLGTYLNKMADDTKQITWDSADELARGHTKRGTGRMTPFDILRSYHACGFSDSSTDHGARWLRGLWRSYAIATRGRSSLLWSNGLKKSLDISDSSDDDVMADTEARADVFAVLTAGEFMSLLKNGQRVEALEMAELCDLEAFSRFLYPHRSNDRQSFRDFYHDIRQRLCDQGASVEYSQRADRDSWQAMFPVNADSAAQSKHVNSALNPKPTFRMPHK